jgi:hypothetical protein
MKVIGVELRRIGLPPGGAERRSLALELGQTLTGYARSRPSPSG